MVWVVAEDYYRSSYSSSLCFGLLFRGEEKVHKNQKDSGRRMGWCGVGSDRITHHQPNQPGILTWMNCRAFSLRLCQDYFHLRILSHRSNSDANALRTREISFRSKFIMLGIIWNAKSSKSKKLLTFIWGKAGSMNIIIHTIQWFLYRNLYKSVLTYSDNMMYVFTTSAQQ